MDLYEICKGFNAAINEEQAYAICHQYIKSLTKKPTSGPENSKGQNGYYLIPTGLQSIVLDENGFVSVSGQTSTHSEREMVEAFGRVLFEALEFGYNENEEREFSPDMERLIERMTLSYDGIISEEDDEGYDAEDDEFHDSLVHGPCTLEVVIKLCEEHLERPSDADVHYLAVCRALITESIDLKSFLEKVSSAEKSLALFSNLNNNNVATLDDKKDFPELNFTEWAHLWIQVVTDLRTGVKLKKVDGQTRNDEFELTPYEVLMEDIRRRNYNLKKVSVNGEIPPRIKHNAHDIILDFIKSRPTLNPSENRKLRPAPPRSKSLHERLIEQIHEGGSPLRHVEPPDDSPLRKRKIMNGSPLPLTTSRSCEMLGRRTPSPSTTSRRRLIKAPTLLEIASSREFNSDSDSDTDCSGLSEDLLSSTVNEDSFSTESPLKRHSAVSTSSLRSSGTSGISSSGCDDADGSYAAGCFKRNTTTLRGRKKLLSVALLPSPVLTPVPDGSSDTLGPLREQQHPGRRVRRANTMSSVRPPTLMNGGDLSPLTAEERRLTWRERRMKGLSFSTPMSEDTVPLPPSGSPLAKREKHDTEFTRSLAGGPGRAKVQRAFSERRQSATKGLMNDSWSYPMECLALTVEELIHIRQVLARAELEKYQGRGELYTNLKKGKICFNCKVRKFSILWWSCSCQICKQKICSKCMRKVRTPTNEYLNTPVYTLSPSLNPHANTSQTFFDADFKVPPPPSRLKTSTSTSVLRERNGNDVTNGLLRQQYRTDGAGTVGSKIRKMDVCEECCDLISRIIQNNRAVTLHQPPSHVTMAPRPQLTPTMGCIPHTSMLPRKSSTFLRRSASSANTLSSWAAPFRNGAPPSSTSTRALPQYVAD